MATDKLVEIDHVTDYISRDAALACFSDWIDRYGHEHTADEMVEYQKIEELPAADARPVVRGKWVEDDYGFIRCSACGMEWDEPEHPKTNFCPNCGADMREATP